MARPATKTPELLELMRHRIASGTYAEEDIPSAQELAEELRVSKFTVHRVLTLLEKEGRLQARSNGRRFVVKAAKGGAGQRRFAIVLPTGIGPAVFRWFETIELLSPAFDARTELIHYSGPSDPRLAGALSDRYDLIFLGAPFLPYHAPRAIARLLPPLKDRIISFFANYPDQDLWGISDTPAVAVRIHVQHLMEQGFRKIDFLQTQSETGGKRAGDMKRAWINALQEFDLKGDHYLTGRVTEDCREIMAFFKKDFAKMKPGAGLIADYRNTAIAACRLIEARGLKVGADVGLTVFEPDPLCPYLKPSLTHLQGITREDVLKQVIRWTLKGETEKRRRWEDHVLSRLRLWVGESSARKAPAGEKK